MLKTSQSNLGFGQFFSPWMTTRKWTSQNAWGPLEVAEMKALSLHPAAGVLQYAQTIFEGMKAFRQADGSIGVFRPGFHQERFQQSAQRVCLPLLPPGAFEEAIFEVVRANREHVPGGDGEALYVRPTLIATEGFLGVRPANEYLFYVICSPVGNYFSNRNQGLRILVETHFSRCAPGGIGAAKAGGNYVASLMAAELAKQKGFDQVLWTDACSHTLVEEVGTMNVFFVMDDGILTPPLSDTLLNGGTRDSAISLLRSQGLRVREGSLTLEQLQSAANSGRLRECFGTGTAAVVSPIRELQDSDATMKIELGPEFPIAEKLRQDITDIQYGRVADPFGWMKSI